MNIFWWCLGILGVYLAIGILVSFALYHTPYRDNGAIIITLLWPLFVYSVLFG